MKPEQHNETILWLLVFGIVGLMGFIIYMTSLIINFE
jgi:preprotein translocase subunit Sss1